MTQVTQKPLILCVLHIPTVPACELGGELNLVAELEDDGEDLVVKIIHLLLQSPQPLKLIVWDLEKAKSFYFFLTISYHDCQVRGILWSPTCTTS